MKNNLQKKTQFVSSNKVGLNNIKLRYHILGHDTVEIREENGLFVVAIPMIISET